MEQVSTTIIVSSKDQMLLVEQVEIEGRVVKALRLEPVCALRVAEMLIQQATDIIEELGG